MSGQVPSRVIAWRGTIRRRPPDLADCVIHAQPSATFAAARHECPYWGFNSMARPRLFFGATAVVLAVVSGGLTSVPQAAASNAESLTSGLVVNSTDVGGLQQFVLQHPDQFAGLYVDRATGTITINVSSATLSTGEQILSQKIAAAPSRRAVSIPSLPARLTVAIHPAPYSQRQLDGVMSAIPHQQPWAAAAAPVLTTWGVDPRNDTVRVGLTQVTPQLTALARATFGSEVTLVPEQRPASAVRITKLPPGSRTVVTSAPAKSDAGNSPAPRSITPNVAPSPSRLLDVMPYYGGDRIYRLYVDSNGVTWVVQCTTSFMWTGYSMSTAGHCAPNGTVWTQGYFDTSNNTLYKTDIMGTVYTTQWGNNRIDGQLMNNPGVNRPYDHFVYTSLTGSTPVVGSDAPTIGEVVCSDGSFTGENCTAEIQQINICVNVSDPNAGTVTYVCGEDRAVSTNGTRLTQPGDSGGPVYVYTNLGPLADGIISAGTNELNPGGATVWFTDVVQAISTFGVTIANQP